MDLFIWQAKKNFDKINLAKRGCTLCTQRVYKNHKKKQEHKSPHQKTVKLNVQFFISNRTLNHSHSDLCSIMLQQSIVELYNGKMKNSWTRLFRFLLGSNNRVVQVYVSVPVCKYSHRLVYDWVSYFGFVV